MGLLAAARTGTGSVIFKPRREKFVCRELYMLENLARIVCGSYTLFARNTKIVCRNKHLYTAFQLNNGEKPKGCKNSSVAGGDKVTVKKARYACRQVYFATVAAITAVVFRNAAVKHDWRNNLNNGTGSIGRSADRITGFRVKYFYIALAAIQDYLFGEECNAGNAVCCGNGRIVCGKVYKEVESHIDGIKPSVKRNWFNLKAHIKYFDAFCFYGKRTVDFCLLCGGKIHLKIFKAILVNTLFTVEQSVEGLRKQKRERRKGGGKTGNGNS